MVTKEMLLELLPPYRDAWVVVSDDQSVRDIIREVLSAHKEFGGYYDRIAGCFDEGTTRDICSALYWFCKHEIDYKEESDESQTTALPTGILIRGQGDCKHYASFCGGVLDALNRRGRNIDWNYRFASYRVFDSTPHHVFIVVHDNGEEIWIDPTPGVKGKVPVWQDDRKVKSMALIRNIAGIGEGEDTAVVPSVTSITQDQLVAALHEVDTSVDISEEDFNAIALLSSYGLINELGEVDMSRMDQLTGSLPEADAQALTDAYNQYLHFAAIGNVFDDIWRGVKVVTLALPRNAYLGLMALNFFGLGSKAKKILDGPDRQKLLDKWHSLGGKDSGITSAANSGAKKPAILGSVNSIGTAPAAAVPAWLALASGIIAAMAPLITSLLKKNNQYSADFAAMDSGMYSYGSGAGNSIMNFIRQNPLIVAAGAAAIIFLVWKD